jgi:hypothetical protein
VIVVGAWFDIAKEAAAAQSGREHWRKFLALHAAGRALPLLLLAAGLGLLAGGGWWVWQTVAAASGMPAASGLRWASAAMAVLFVAWFGVGLLFPAAGRSRVLPALLVLGAAALFTLSFLL